MSSGTADPGTIGAATWHWTDEWRPTAPTTMSAREAAVAMLADMDWARIIEEQPWFDDMDPLAYYGLRDQLYETDWMQARRFPARLPSHLTAWVTSRLVVRHWCVADGHADDMIPFDDCWYGDGDPDSPCVWGSCWVVDDDPEGFFRLASALIRDGWQPDSPGVER